MSRNIIDRSWAQLMVWSKRGIQENRFILLLAFLVGVLTAFAGLLLKWLIAHIQYLLSHQFSDSSSNWLYLIYPVVGIFLTSVFIRRIVRDDIGHGVTKILFALARKQSNIKSHNCWSSLIASAITIGFGGSVGAEAPIVLTGSAIGSNLGRMFRLNAKQLMLLVGCGAAGAVAGIFKAPIAGLAFVLEVLMIDLSMGSLLGGTAIVEVIFTYPGMGNLAVNAITGLDYPVVQAYVLWVALIYMVINLIVDISYNFIDPRMRVKR